MTPLICGYLRVTDDLDDHEIRQRDPGFRLNTIYYEDMPIRQDAVHDLRRELRRAQTRQKVMPSLEHGADTRAWVVKR